MQRAIIDGKTEAGITTMLMDEGIDTGAMLLRGSICIEENDNFEIVHDKLGACSVEVLMQTLKDLRAGVLNPIPQDDAGASYAAKIENADCILDLSQDARTLHNRIRGLSPFPLAFVRTPDGKMLKLVASEVSERDASGATAGEVIALENGRITVACGSGALDLLSVLPEGKKRMSAADFINGRRINVGDLLK